MSKTITILNNPEAATHPVEITTAPGPGDELSLTCDGRTLKEGCTVFLKHDRPGTNDPVVVPVTFRAPPRGWVIEASHELDSGQTIAWTGNGTEDCTHTWAETEHEYEVTAKATNTASGTAKLTKVYIKVRPEPDLPG